MVSPRSSGRQAVSALHADGTLVELVYDQDSEETKFAIGQGGEVAVVEAASDAKGEPIIPVAASNNLIRHGAILLPPPPVPYESMPVLRASIEAYLNRYVDLSPRMRVLASAYVLLSWVHDAMPELPYLRFRGDFGSGKTRALKVLGSITYRPLFATGAATVSPIFHALDLFRGTLVIDEADYRLSDERAELTKILNQGNVKGFPVLRSQATPQKTFDPRAFHVFGPKVIGMRHRYDDLALESRFLTEEMGQRPLRPDIPINLPDAQAEEASVLRGQLLAYRFNERGQVAARAELASSDLSARGNQVLIPLLSVVDDEALIEVARQVMAETEANLHGERAESPEGQLLNVLLFLQRDRPGQSITVGDIAAAWRTLPDAERDRPITARYVGEVLRRRLHLTPLRRHGTYMLPLEAADRVRVLAERFGLRPEPE